MIFTERTTRATLTLLPQLTPALTALMKHGQMRAKVNHLLNESTWGRLWKIWGATLKKITVTRRTLIAEETLVSPVTSPEKRSDDESQNQLSALVEAEVRDLFHLGGKCSGQNHYTALENQRETLIRLVTSLQDLDKKSSQTLHSGRTGSKNFTCHCCQR